VYGGRLQRRVASFGIEDVLTAPRNPWQNANAERDAPDRRPVQLPDQDATVAVPEMGRLHHHYERRAALGTA
jgi:transposase InsO family protein